MTILTLIHRAAKAIERTPEAITSSSRKKHIVYARHAIASIAWEFGYKERTIAPALNRRNLATICNSRKRSRKLYMHDIEYRYIYNQIASS